jgi:hypothetical protein
MSVHADMRPWQKGAWILLMGAFLILEFRAIDKDRADNETKQTALRKEERKSFQSVLQQNQQQFSTTMNGTKENINNITGGDSFCFLDVFYPNDPGPYWTAFQRGGYPLYEVEARVVDVNKFDKLIAGNSAANISIATSGSNTILKINNLSPKQAHAGRGPLSLDASGHQKFDVYFMARNGFWTELLRLQRQHDKWYEAKRVLRIDDGKERIIFEQVDKGYHNVDWTE